MASKEKYTDRRWTDIPLPKVIGEKEFTAADKKKIDEETEKFMKEHPEFFIDGKEYEKR